MALHITMTIPGEPAAIEAALEGLIGINVVLMRRRAYPSLYDTDVKYQLERPGDDDWQTCDRLLRSKRGDCEDVVGYRVAELRVAGELGARPRVVPVPDRDDAFHTFVQRQDGSLEDPSKLLIAKEQTMADNKPTICVRDVGNHCLGVMEVPLRDGRKATVQQLGFDAWGALTGVFHEIVSNPGIMALISPEAAVAITVAKRISDMSPDELKALAKDPKATDAQKKLAKEVLKSPAKGGGGAAAPAAAKTKNDWVIWDGGGSVGETKKPAPYYMEGDLPIVRTHPTGATQSVPARGVTAPMTPVPGMTHGGPMMMPPQPGTSSTSAASTVAAGTRVTDTGGATAPATTSTIDPTTGQYISPDGSPFVWIPGTDSSHPGHWVRGSSLQQPGTAPGGLPLPGYPPPGYPGGMMPPTYPPSVPGYPGYPGYPPMPGYPGYPPMPGIDPSAMMYGYPYPYAPPYGYGGAPNWPMTPPGWWGSPGGQQPEPMSPEEMAAVQLWGADSFASGSFPGLV